MSTIHAMSTVHGVEIPNASAVAGLVDQQLGGGGVWSDPSDYTPIEGLERAIQAAGPLVPAFAAALVGLLGHADLKRRAGAIASLWKVAGHVSGDDVMKAFDAHPDRFRGVSMPAGYPDMGADLEAALVMALAQAGATGGSQLQAFYRQHLNGPAKIWALLGLAAAAPDWVVAQARTVVPRRAIAGVVGKIPDRAHREALVRALAPWGDDGNAVVASSAWTLLKLPDDEKAALAAILQGRS